MGEKVGETPIQIVSKDIFPNIYPKEKESVYGRVTLKRAGCEDYTRTVSSEISNNGLHAQLDCGVMDSIQTPAHIDAPPRSNESVELRLEKIRELLGKGLITEEEAGKARARIIDEL